MGTFLGKSADKYNPPSSNAQAGFLVSQGTISSTIRDLFAYASLPCTLQPDHCPSMVDASAGINAGISDVSAPFMWREQFGPALQSVNLMGCTR